MILFYFYYIFCNAVRINGEFWKHREVFGFLKLIPVSVHTNFPYRDVHNVTLTSEAWISLLLVTYNTWSFFPSIYVEKFHLVRVIFINMWRKKFCWQFWSWAAWMNPSGSNVGPVMCQIFVNPSFSCSQWQRHVRMVM